jgi:hypothetical protein
MDACQRVNNVVYARRLETAPMAYLERIGLVVDRLRGAIAAVEAPGAGEMANMGRADLDEWMAKGRK